MQEWTEVSRVHSEFNDFVGRIIGDEPGSSQMRQMNVAECQPCALVICRSRFTLLAGKTVSQLLDGHWSGPMNERRDDMLPVLVGQGGKDRFWSGLTDFGTPRMLL
jgi:hypothetical protein